MPKDEVGECRRPQFTLKEARSFRCSRCGVTLSDNEKALAALRHEARSVDDEGVHGVAKIVESEQCFTEIRAAMGGEKACNVL